jgi:very-short-patch-repair endonuclease
VVNFPILDDTGWPIYWLDLAYPDLRLAIEYDGRGHVGDHQQMEWDATRRRHLEDRGWRIITVTAADAREGFRSLVASVRTQLATRPA